MKYYTTLLLAIFYSCIYLSCQKKLQQKELIYEFISDYELENLSRIRDLYDSLICKDYTHNVPECYNNHFGKIINSKSFLIDTSKVVYVLNNINKEVFEEVWLFRDGEIRIEKSPAVYAPKKFLSIRQNFSYLKFMQKYLTQLNLDENLVKIANNPESISSFNWVLANYDKIPFSDEYVRLFIVILLITREHNSYR